MADAYTLRGEYMGIRILENPRMDDRIPQDRTPLRWILDEDAGHRRDGHGRLVEIVIGPGDWSRMAAQVAASAHLVAKDPPCRWCKGTGVILGFAWEQYPCECREPASELPPGYTIDPWPCDGHFAVRGPGRNFDYSFCRDRAHAIMFAWWVHKEHRALESMSWPESNTYFEALSEADRNRWIEMRGL